MYRKWYFVTIAKKFFRLLSPEFSRIQYRNDAVQEDARPPASEAHAAPPGKWSNQARKTISPGVASRGASPDLPPRETPN